MAFQQVAILGLGLIGSSIGLALKRGPDAPRVVGFDISSDNLHRATRSGSIERAFGTLPDVCRGSDLVVLAAPVSAILQLLPQISPLVESGALVTDTGSTKREIVRVASSALPAHVSFVGGHPLAGPLTAGVTDASPGLFSGAIYCLTPTPSAPDAAVGAAVQLVETLGAQPYFLDPDEHDSLMAVISHLPHFASVALMNAVAAQSSWAEMGAMAAGGFRAVTALADGPPEVWRDIATTNKENVARQLDALIEQLSLLKSLILSEDAELVAELRRARAARDAWISGRREAPPEKGPPETHASSGRGWMPRFLRS